MESITAWLLGLLHMMQHNDANSSIVSKVSCGFRRAITMYYNRWTFMFKSRDFIDIYEK